MRSIKKQFVDFIFIFQFSKLCVYVHPYHKNLDSTQLTINNFRDGMGEFGTSKIFSIEIYSHSLSNGTHAPINIVLFNRQKHMK